MRWILWTVAILIAAVGVSAIVGWMLPVRHEASRSASVSQPAAAVYAVIADVSAYPNWCEGVSRVELLESSPGTIRFREHTKNGPIVMEVAEAVAPSRFVTRIADPDQPFGGTWTFELTPDGNGTRVTITERGEIYNPIFRVMARFVFGYTATMDAFLRSLQAHLDTTGAARR
jgi:ribosome-associated toxin RatA of RatAB toxin-antitoxin module